MQRTTGRILIFILAGLLAAGTCAGCRKSADRDKLMGLPELTVTFATPGWGGGHIPPGQQCNRFGGEGSTPSLIVADIPPEADALVLEFCDKTYPPLDGGGMGEIGYLIDPGTDQTTVPSVPGHTFDLPRGFYSIHPHRNPKWDISGAYLPPCSGGDDHFYYAVVKAVILESENGRRYKTLAKGKIDMGYY